MLENIQKKLITGELKAVETEILSFYETIGDMQNLNKKMTTIFGYFQIYGSLTQEQLKFLTKFSSSTISTVLQAFVQLGIIVREPLRNSRKKIYILQKERVSFVYIPFPNIMNELELFDELLKKIQEKLKNLKNENPGKINFFNIRINSIRNYVEAQRRAIQGKKKYNFFLEKDLNNFDNFIDYSKELEKFESEIIDFISRYKLSYEPIQNRILAYFTTRKYLSQQKLEELIGISRSTISRTLELIHKDWILNKSERGFRQPTIYYMNSFSDVIISKILLTDDYIFSWVPKYSELLKILRTIVKTNQNSEYIGLLEEKIESILKEIKDFKHGSKILFNAHQELIKSVI